jgi:hypothetical protein
MTEDSVLVSDRSQALTHYVLFGPPEQPATAVNLRLAQDYLLAFTPAFGFHPGEAAAARAVTIVAETAAVSEQVEAGLVAVGAKVQRICGTPAEVARALARRVAGGQAF